MPERSSLRWLDASQPQILQAAVLLSYINAGLAALYLLIGVGSFALLVLLLIGGCAIGIANERRVAYVAAIVLTGIYLALQLFAFLKGAGIFQLLNLLFAGVLFALLVHPHSREYQRIWFH